MNEEPPGFEWWVSLDEHLSWFGGAHQMRADLLRVSMRFEDDGAVIGLQIVESKFRRTEDIGVADKQLRRTKSLLSRRFSPRARGRCCERFRFWRRELATALNETSRRPVPLHDSRPSVSMAPMTKPQSRDSRATLTGRLRAAGVRRGVRPSDRDPWRCSRRGTPAGFPLLRMPRSPRSSAS